MRIAVVIAILSLISSNAFAKTIHVPGDYSKIQEAIDAAVDMDIVLVAPGTYMEHRIDFKGKAITVTSSHGPELTHINAQMQGSVVVFMNEEGPNSVLKGLTLKRGSGTFGTNSNFYGGGIYCTESSPTILTNIIHKCTADGGAGIGCAYGSSPIIKYNIIYENEAIWGAGIRFHWDCGGFIENNIIYGNHSKGRGGGIYCRADCFTEIRNNSIFGNTCEGQGGGIMVWGSEVLIVNNTINGNYAKYGGGICLYASSPHVINNHIVNNSAEEGGGFYCCHNSSPIITNTILWDNSAPSGPEIWIGTTSYPSIPTISYSDVQGGQSLVYIDPGCGLNWDPGMIDADPLFVDEANDDFHLTFPSPCKDTGDNTAVTEPTDFEGDPRIAYGTVDMGADEFYTHLYWTGEATPGGNVELKFVGLPGTTPVQLWLGSGVLNPPWPTKYGDWYLQFPLIVNMAMGTIPSDGVLVFPFTFPANTPTPLTLPFQSGIGVELSNLSVMEVE